MIDTGFRKGVWSTVWSVEPVSDSFTKGRISVSRKNKDTGEYEQDFSGYVAFSGTAAAKKALALQEKDRIKLGDVDCTTKYDPEKRVTYYNFKIFSFDTQAEYNAEDGGGYVGYNTSAPAFDPAAIESSDREELPF